MSEADDAAAKRAALAEARRQKILARGADRLNRITLGTPLPEAAPPGTTAEPAAVAVAPADTAVAPGEESTPTSAPAASPAPPPPAPAAAPASAAEAPTPSPELPAAAPEDVAASMRQAEQAMHALLNQLSDPRPGQLPGDDGGVASLLQAMAAQAAAASAAAGPGSTAAQPPRGLLGGLGAEPAARASPGPASAARPGAAPASAGPVGRSGGGGAGAGAGAGAALEAVLGGVGAVLMVVAGPRLSGAVARTRLARCLLALVVAAALHAGLVEPAALRVPPLVLLLLMEAALVAGAWVLVRGGGGGGSGLSRSGSMSRVGSLSSMSLDRMAAEADADSGGAAGAGGAATAGASAGAGPSPPPKFDYLTLVPGLRPLLDGLSSLQALVGGLVGDVAVFVAATVALAACSDLMRPLAVGAGAAGGRVEL